MKCILMHGCELNSQYDVSAEDLQVCYLCFYIELPGITHYRWLCYDKCAIYLLTLHLFIKYIFIHNSNYTFILDLLAISIRQKRFSRTCEANF